jgi:5-methylcytosine-specific restriction protein A
VAKEIWLERKSIGAGVAELTETHRMNDSSARDYITDFTHLMEGRIFHRTMNVYATGYFLEKIQEDFGPNALRLAIKSQIEHVDYYERLRKTRLNKIRAVLKRFTSTNVPYEPYAKFLDEFENKVESSQSDTSENRRKRLQKTSKRPSKVLVISEQFVRNPDVVVEVLLRAKGYCERCKNKAHILKFTTLPRWHVAATIQ